VFHSAGVVSGFDYLTVMGDPVEHGGGHLLVAEDLGPLAGVLKTAGSPTHRAPVGDL
jgi:hypothetical protein